MPGASSTPRSSGSPSRAARRWSWPKDSNALGMIHLKDIVKGGMRERFDELRAMGIRTVMITGDNRLTAAAIAAEAGVDDFLAEATPETKLALIRDEQAEGRLVAMTGDGTNDAPALAQADVGVAMNTGTQAAKEAGNMVDLDSNPTKLIEIVEIGKQLLITRGALTTFSIANDVAKYFAILPAMFAFTYADIPAARPSERPEHHAPGDPQSAILSAVIFNALIIVGAHPARAAGRALTGRSAPPRCCAATADLRRRRRDPALHRHQADRPRGAQRARLLTVGRGLTLGFAPRLGVVRAAATVDERVDERIGGDQQVVPAPGEAPGGRGGRHVGPPGAPGGYLTTLG